MPFAQPPSHPTKQPPKPLEARLQDLRDLVGAGRLDEAEMQCAALLLDHPHQKAALLIQGVIHSKQGRIGEAETLFREGWALYPDHAGFASNLGRLLIGRGDYAGALDPLATSVLAEPDNAEHKKFMARAWTGSRYLVFDANAAKALILCLGDARIDWRHVADIWLNLLELDPAMEGIWPLFVAQDYEAFVAAAPGDLPARLLNVPLLLAGLDRVILKSPVLENGLAFTRHWLLDHESEEDFDFICALAAACFGNDYLFAETEKEHTVVERLGFTPRDIALRACYRPLWREPDPARFGQAAAALDHPAFTALIRLQVDNPLLEQDLRNNIRQLTPIEDTVSCAVQGQYEENPYPRWTTADQSPPSPAKQALSRGKRILVAGCGTGREAASMALLYPRAQVIAVDLSRASLGYAIRQCVDLGITNVEFFQADILELGSLDQRFDLISSSGVLHHMRDTFGAWRRLMGLLAPGGVFHIALYSAIARASFQEVRDWVTAGQFGTDADGIRAIRHAVFALDEHSTVRQILTHAHDFYSLSECRDLVMHVEEHCFTLPDIRVMRDRLALDLFRMDVRDPSHAAQYRKDYPQDKAMTDLNNWHKFEQDNPYAFAGMYSMWFKRRGEDGDFRWL